MANRQAKSYVSNPWGALESTESIDEPAYHHRVVRPISGHLASGRPGRAAVIGSAKSGSGEYALEGGVSDRVQNDAAGLSALEARSGLKESALASTFSSLLQPVDLASTGARSLLLGPELTVSDVEAYPEGAYVQVAALLSARRLAQAAGLLQRLDILTAGRPDRSCWARRVEFLWAVYANQTADPSGVLEHCAVAAACADEPRQSDSHADADAVTPLLGAIDGVIAGQLPLLTARAHIGLGQPEQAEAILLDWYGSREETEASQPAIMAMVACCQGRLGAATRLASAALEAAQRQDTAAELADLEARLVLAEVLVERDQLDAAWRQLQAALRLYWLSGATASLWAVEIDLARVLVAQGRAAEAVHRLQYLRAEAAGFLAQPLVQKLNQLSIECHLEVGDPEGALLIAKSMLSPDIPVETRARLDLCAGRPDRAVARLRASSSPRLAVEVRRLILLACAEKQQGETARARSTMLRAVDTARPERYVRPFLERAAQTVSLLRDIGASSHDPYLRQLIGEAERLAPTASTGNAAVLEPLTERERQILRYLPSHLTLGQIGLTMFLSTNTVKTHVKAIYRKVGAVSRHDAVKIAREQGLV